MLNQPLVQLPFNGVEVMINNTGTSFVIRFHMTCIVYARLIQFHLSERHTSSAHQLIAGFEQLWYFIMFRTSGRFVNLL